MNRKRRELATSETTGLRKYAGIEVVMLLDTGNFCVESVFMRHCEASCRSGKIGGWEHS